jgi:hypothetical protein
MLREMTLGAAAAVAVTMLSAGTGLAQTGQSTKPQAGQVTKPGPAAQAATTADAHDAAKTREELDKAIETLRKDARAGKADILGKTMALDSTQAAAFWPIYKQYESELTAIGNDRLAVIQDLAEHWNSLDDAKAKGLLERQLAYEDKRIALVKKYKDEMLKVLPAKTVARFLQVDSRLNKLLDLAIASETPLVQ